MKQKAIILELFSATLLLIVGLCNADTPANCTYNDILGKWMLYEGERTNNRAENCSELGKRAFSLRS